MFYDTLKQDKQEPSATYDISSEATQPGTQPQQQTQQEDAQTDQDLDIDQDIDVWIGILEKDAEEVKNMEGNAKTQAHSQLLPSSHATEAGIPSGTTTHTGSPPLAVTAVSAVSATARMVPSTSTGKPRNPDASLSASRETSPATKI